MYILYLTYICYYITLYNLLHNIHTKSAYKQNMFITLYIFYS